MSTDPQESQANESTSPDSVQNESRDLCALDDVDVNVRVKQDGGEREEGEEEEEERVYHCPVRSHMRARLRHRLTHSMRVEPSSRQILVVRARHKC